MALPKSAIIHPVIIIPVFNGRDSLLSLIKRIKDLVPYPILVIDDGSSDGLKQSSLPGTAFIRHEMNRGKGAALKSGLDFAQQMGYSHAVSLDADGQHAPEFIEAFVKHAVDSPAAFIIGERNFEHYKMPFHRKLSNNITSLILSLRSGFHIRDSQVGYRCYPLIDSRLWDSHEDGFQFESTVFFNAEKLQLRLIWQAIPVIYGEEESHMNLVKDTLRFIRTILRSFKW